MSFYLYWYPGVKFEQIRQCKHSVNILVILIILRIPDGVAVGVTRIHQGNGFANSNSDSKIGNTDSFGRKNRQAPGIMGLPRYGDYRPNTGDYGRQCFGHKNKHSHGIINDQSDSTSL